MQLVIAEKPSVAMSIAAVIGATERKDGYIAELTKKQETAYAGWEFDGGTVEANREDNRLQIFFEEKPDEKTRETLKENGFRWSPKAGAWQRQLNDNAICAAPPGRGACGSVTRSSRTHGSITRSVSMPSRQGTRYLPTPWN